jgi:thymidylate synthase
MPRVSKNHPEYQYLDLLEEIYKHGVKNVDRGTGDTSYSLFGRQARFDLSKGFPLLTTKKVFWRGIVEELYWFISGQNNIKYLVDKNVHIWDDYPYKIYREKVDAGKEPDITKEEFIAKIAASKTYAKKYGNLPKIYGELWRHWPTRKPNKTIDQLKWMIEELKQDPFARNAIVSSWNPEYLYSMAEPSEAARFPLCHIFYQTSIKDGKLNLHLYQRTCDMFLGVPFNIACYALLTMIIAKITGNEPGEFIHSYGDVHIYQNHMQQVKEQLKRTPRPLPAVKIKGKLNSIDDFKPENVVIENYNPHPALKGELSVSGGFFTKYAKEKKTKN